MSRHETIFEIESKADAYAVERLMNRLYDMVREESRTLRSESRDSTEMLEQFETLRDATNHPTPGKLRVVYESPDEGFDD